MPMLNRELYAKDPRQATLMNNGVAELAEDFAAEGGARVLRYELETFVCDGQYAKGLASILEQYLRNLDALTDQPGVWISGFYGSGKSHLAKMLRVLWTDHKFPDGAGARGLAHLPPEVKDPLKELSHRAARHGGLHAAAGKLGAGAKDYVRLALLEILFKSAGLPASCHQARFLLWLRKQGIESAVRAHLDAVGKTLEGELAQMYVSPPLGEALIKAMPAFAPDSSTARQHLRAQFPQVADVSNDELVADVRAALERDGKFPLTLVVLDEVQQYIGADQGKVYQVQEMTETLCKHFKGQLLFVATGQSALADTPLLQKLMGRFPSKVMLGDWDVEHVTRKIILAKKPSVEQDLKKVLDNELGEISRHLRGTKIEHTKDDEALLTSDYPILPVRRRLWDRLLRSLDVTGATAQLRNQLRVVHEAVADTAELPLGHVVATDYLYDQNAANLAATSQLPMEVFNRIKKLEDMPAPGPLKARVLKLVYLLGKLPVESTQALGLRTTQDVLADLLVTDLAAGSSKLRQDLPDILKDLQDQERIILSLPGEKGTEYRLQTQESSSWLETYRSQESALRNSPQKTEQARAEALREALKAILNKVSVKHGKAHEVRPLRIIWDEHLPKDHAHQLSVWVQDGWQGDERAVLTEARKTDTQAATLFVFVPADHRTALADALIARDAAQATLTTKAKPTTSAGEDALRNMQKRLADAEEDIRRLLQAIVKGARVFQAGGHEVLDGDDLAARIQGAAQASLIRLYPNHAAADHEGWPKVFQEAQKGSVEAMKAVAHAGEPDGHPVCKKLMEFIGGGAKGQDVREQFSAPPYGWSRDVVDGGLLALLATGHLRATDAGGHPLKAAGFDRSKLTQATFRVENITITSVQKIRIRGVFVALGLSGSPEQEAAVAPQVLPRLRTLAEAAGGAAPAPVVPTDPILDELAHASGNALLLALHDRGEAIKQLAAAWEATAKLIAARRPAWDELTRLLRLGQGMDGLADLQNEAGAILEHRRLLADPDPVLSLRDQVAQKLREAVKDRIGAVQAAFRSGRTVLEADDAWTKLTEAQKETVNDQHQLVPPAIPDLATAQAVGDALEACSLEAWKDRADAVESRFASAKLTAARLILPAVHSVKLPARILEKPEQIDTYLHEVKTLLVAALEKGPVSV